MAVVVIKRGDVVRVDLAGATGKERQDPHPALVIQNDMGNAVSPLTIIAPITRIDPYENLPVQVPFKKGEGGLAKDRVIELGHIRTIDRDARIDAAKGVVGVMAKATMEAVDKAIKVSLSVD